MDTKGLMAVSGHHKCLGMNPRDASLLPGSFWGATEAESHTAEADPCPLRPPVLPATSAITLRFPAEALRVI